MQFDELKNTDPEDIEDVLVKVETLFDIRFVGDELVSISTFGELCDHIQRKIQLVHVDDCTSQQAFYKLRNAISSTLFADKHTISTEFPLSDLLTRQNRRLRVRLLEGYLGFKLNILRPPNWVINILTVLFLVSVIGLFINWKIGMAGLFFSLAGLTIADKTGNELDLQTVGQLAKKMTRENFRMSGRNPDTFNKTEVEKVLTDLFSESLGLDKSRLTREARLWR